MTAEIVLMNKNGVAIAADSAVTIYTSNDVKAINTSNKIYPIANHNIAVMNFGGAEFHGIPWDVIANMWHEYLPAQLNSLEEYAEKFIEHLKNMGYYYLPEDNRVEYLESVIFHIFGFLFSNIKEDQDLTIDKLILLLDKLIKELHGFEDVKHASRIYSSVIRHENRIKNIVSEILSKLNINPNDEFYIKIIKCVYLFSSKNHNTVLDWRSGIVIVGYGKNDIFPGVVSFVIYGFLDGEIIYNTINDHKISIDSPIFAESYGQDGDIKSFIMGLNDTILRNQIELLKNILSKKLGEENDAFISEIIKEFRESINDYRQKEFYLPIMYVIDSLSPKDLAILAESLVNLSVIRKKYSMDNETVGGPVDVAIITKKDGFQWIKKK
jgi:hypothetical protein